MLDGLKFSLFHHQFPVASLPFPVSYMQECITPLVVFPGRPIQVILFSAVLIKSLLPHPVGARSRSWLVIGIFQMAFFVLCIDLSVFVSFAQTDFSLFTERGMLLAFQSLFYYYSNPEAWI